MKSTAHTFNEENIEYLREYIGDQEVETFLRLEVTTENATLEEKRIHETVKMCLEQMEKDGDNRWWINKDRKDEMALNYNKLKEEAEKAFKGHTEF